VFLRSKTPAVRGLYQKETKGVSEERVMRWRHGDRKKENFSLFLWENLLEKGEFHEKLPFSLHHFDFDGGFI